MRTRLEKRGTAEKEVWRLHHHQATTPQDATPRHTPPTTAPAHRQHTAYTAPTQRLQERTRTHAHRHPRGRAGAVWVRDTQA